MGHFTYISDAVARQAIIEERIEKKKSSCKMMSCDSWGERTEHFRSIDKFSVRRDFVFGRPQQWSPCLIVKVIQVNQSSTPDAVWVGVDQLLFSVDLNDMF